MLLNDIEYWLMNNPVRAAVQRYHEFPYLRKHSKSKGGKILEIGCGNGYGTVLIQEHFSASKVCGIDLDARMIERAKKRNPSGCFTIGDITQLPYRKTYFDAVVDCGVLHHVSNWKDAITQVRRVLKPKGEFIIEDFSKEFFSTPVGRITKALTVHPYEQMYTYEELTKELKRHKFRITHQTKRNFAGFGYFVIVARKE